LLFLENKNSYLNGYWGRKFWAEIWAGLPYPFYKKLQKQKAPLQLCWNGALKSLEGKFRAFIFYKRREISQTT